jgi:Na+/phosphate symporter
VLVDGFISSGLMTLAQSIGIILGANLGTTITAQIIAFNVTRFSLLLVSVGFGLTFFSNAEARRTWGALVMGLGLVFFGIVLGANIGTSVTAGLAAIGEPREAQRAALAHALFNVTGVIVWVPFIGTAHVGGARRGRQHGPSGRERPHGVQPGERAAVRSVHHTVRRAVHADAAGPSRGRGGRHPGEVPGP